MKKSLHKKEKKYGKPLGMRNASSSLGSMGKRKPPRRTEKNENNTVSKIKYEELEIAYQKKSKMLMRLTHELKTPLNAVYGFAQILEKELKEKQQEGDLSESVSSVQNILYSCTLMQQMLDKILDFELIDSGNLKINLQYVQLFPLLRQVVAFFEPTTISTNHVIKVIDPKNLKNIAQNGELLGVNADPLKMKHILINLISNALKYSKSESIIYIYPAIRDKYVDIVVQNEGVPDEPISTEKIFSDFTRLKEHEHISGTGLGLSLSLALAKVQKGNISCAVDNKNNTTSFIVSLPISLPMDEVKIERLVEQESLREGEKEQRGSSCKINVFAICSNSEQKDYVSQLMSFFQMEDVIFLPDMDYAKDILEADETAILLCTAEHVVRKKDPLDINKIEKNIIFFNPNAMLKQQMGYDLKDYYQGLFKKELVRTQTNESIGGKSNGIILADPLFFLSHRLLFKGIKK